MQAYTISKLLEKLDKQQYSNVIRNFTQHNKRMKIPGFSHMEKAPVKLVVNSARTNKAFCKALLESVSKVILSGTEINLERDISDIKKDIPNTAWLGLAAFLLLLENDAYTVEAESIIDEYDDDQKQESPVQESAILPKPDKKEEKFREKYLNARIDISELTTELEKQTLLLQKANAEIDQLREEKKDLEQRCISYLAQLDALIKDNRKLLEEQKAVQAKLAAAQSAPQPKLDVLVLAPNCTDILSKYTDTIPIAFDDTTKLSMTEAIEKYDEIWVFPDVISFGAYRALRRWKQFADEKVIIFQTATDVVAYAEKLIQNR